MAVESMWDDPALRRTLPVYALKYLEKARSAEPIVEKHLDFLEEAAGSRSHEWDEAHGVWKLMWEKETEEYFRESYELVEEAGVTKVLITHPALPIMNRWGLAELIEVIAGPHEVLGVNRSAEHQDANLRRVLRVEQEVAFWATRFVNHPGLSGKIRRKTISQANGVLNLLGYYPRGGGDRANLASALKASGVGYEEPAWK